MNLSRPLQALLLSALVMTLPMTLPTAALACTPGGDGVVLEQADVDWTLAVYGVKNLTPGNQFAVEIVLCSAPEETEIVEVGATMPTHGHGMNYKPEITRTNHGAFVTTGWLMHMAGNWEIEIKTRNGSQYATFIHSVDVEP